MLNELQKVTIQRFIELLFVNIVLSMVITKWNLVQSGGVEYVILISLSIGVVIYLTINIKMLQACYKYLGDKGDYNYVNYVAYGSFVTTHLIIYGLGDSELYTWLFGITKFAKYIPFEVSNIASAVIFHIIMVVTTLLVPIGMSLCEEEESVDDEEI